MKIKSIIAGLLGAMLFSTFSPVTSTAEAANIVPVYLKVGKYSILYTQPAPPFADEAHRVQVPLRSIEDLLGGKVKYNSVSKTADVEWVGHTFQITVGSKMARIDGKTVEMDTTPILKSQAMFLPIRFFLDATDLKWRWDQEGQQLVLSDERVIAGEPFEDFMLMDGPVVKDEQALVIQSYSVEGNYMTINALNVSGHAIAAGKTDIQPLFHYRNGQFSIDPYNRPIALPLDAVQKGGIVSKKVQGRITEDMDYVITVGRELK
ncbi:copper amine oxidase N-terminal domain-containing protein [Saccharibacillus qingshengii]|uniref:copper amine oxidase N-terminal domain-containing protein n=1 Tax=Saccharibacillus qingshengii TaxID=1763540 RepID=UPI001554AE31|nr:copper amine oxidase N-terminal domain-containing protein [Saccharibacillus qingshengii]